MHTITRIAVGLLMAAPLVAAITVGSDCTDTTSPVGPSGTSGTMSTGGTGGTGGNDGGPGGNDSGGCGTIGTACMSAADCCTGTCIGGVCNLPPCTSDNQTCSTNGECCGGNCTAGKCVPLNMTCKTLGNDCSVNDDCCSHFCAGGKCLAPSFCGQENEFCTKATDCCGGICNVTNDGGLGFGTCGPPPVGPSNCTKTAGMLCGDGVVDGGLAPDSGPPDCGGDCCSRLCAPYPLTGVFICQPASGCHVVGDLCTKDGDCCGSEGLPGGSGSPVKCEITPPSVVGICRNPMGCKPDGDVCKLATMSCNATCNCCSGNCENEDTCHLDNLGIPRCSGACVDAGGACATSANCCDGLPCVPNPVDGGMPPFICFQGGCVPPCGKCTVNADCCPGETCDILPGSTNGTCGPCGPMPDGGVDAGDAGPPCALLGQQCSADGDCCNGVPCNSGNGPCQPGMLGCTCHFILK